MDKKIILILAIIVLVFIGVTFIFGNHKWVGNVIAAFDDEDIDSYSYTTAMCNESNFCQDYEVSCQGDKIIDVNPIVGAVIQQPDDWVDSREDKGLCEY